MAKSPDEANNTYGEKVQEIADRVEVIIDNAIDKHYVRGLPLTIYRSWLEGIFEQVIELEVDFNHVVEELGKRYKDWHMTYKEGELYLSVISES